MALATRAELQPQPIGLRESLPHLVLGHLLSLLQLRTPVQGRAARGLDLIVLVLSAVEHAPQSLDLGAQACDLAAQHFQILPAAAIRYSCGRGLWCSQRRLEDHRRL